MGGHELGQVKVREVQLEIAPIRRRCCRSLLLSTSSLCRARRVRAGHLPGQSSAGRWVCVLAVRLYFQSGEKEGRGRRGGNGAALRPGCSEAPPANYTSSHVNTRLWSICTTI